MTKKRFYAISEEEYWAYWVADLSKVTKTKEDFFDESEEMYDIPAFEEYLKENNAVLKEEELIDLLNEQDGEIKELKKEIKSLITNLEEDYILVKRCKNVPETKYCSECLNYETEYEEVYAFGDYETLTKTSCSKGHHILDNTDATNCPDYVPE